ncbi:MAG: hypothetical protein V1742_10010 [Pseudomonadota bacterium]
MNKHTRQKNLFKMASTVILVLVMAFYATQTAAETALAQISTKAGDLVLMEQGQERYFRLKEKVVLRGTSFMTIYRFLRPRGYDALLITDFTGPIECPLRFQFLALFANGAHEVSPAFGHCSDQPQLTVKGREVIMAFPAFGSQAARTYVFDGRELRLRP